MPSYAKARLSNLLAGPLAGRILRRFHGRTIAHRGAMITIANPRVEDRTVAQLFWRIYERAEADQIAKYLPANMDVIELGASAGVNTVNIARVLDKARRLIACEADPDLCELARENLKLNKLDERVEVIHAAVAYDTSSVQFARGNSSLAGRIAGSNCEEHLSVPAITVSELAQKGGLDKFNLVMDIEGAEWEVITSDLALDKCERIIAELHETKRRELDISVHDLVSVLQGRGFSVLNRDGACYVFARAHSER